MDKLERLAIAANEKDGHALRRALASIDMDVSFAPILAHLLLEDWHDAHEEIVEKLGHIGHHGAVEAIEKVASKPIPRLVQRNLLHSFQRKCAYALARIGTVESRAALEDLAASGEPHLREFAREGLAMWPLPYTGD
jgi:hypothetical protein